MLAILARSAHNRVILGLALTEDLSPAYAARSPIDALASGAGTAASKISAA